MKIQKVKHLKDELKKKTPDIEHSYLISEKLDGWYTYIDYDKFTGWGSIMSSSGRVIPSMQHYVEHFDNLRNPKQNTRLIMEAVIPDTPFHILNGVFNRSKGDCRAFEVEFNIHDIVSSSIYHTAALDRYRQLQYIDETKTIKTVSALATSNDPKEWEDLFKTVIDNGGEGIILKNINSLYQPGKRNSSLMKMKQQVTMDLEVIDYFSSIGAKRHLAWNLVCKRKNGVLVTVVVARHSDIAKFAVTTPIGLVVEIKAMKELDNGSLREPTFKCIREDKTILDLVD